MRRTSFIRLGGLVITLLAGLAFGPVLGTLYVMIGATAGLTPAFLVARYASRGLIASWVEENECLRRLDGKFERQGWRVLATTRLLPLFPSNILNYACGPTKIGSKPMYRSLRSANLRPRRPHLYLPRHSCRILRTPRLYPRLAS